MDDARALLDVETPPETGSVTASAVKRRAMWGMLWSGVLSAIVVLVLFMPKTEHGGSKDLVQLAQWPSDFDALDVEAERADFGRLATKASELADLLRVLRGSVMRSPALPKEFFAETREKILELLQTLQGKVSPLDAVKLGISVTTKDLAKLGVPLEDSTAPKETNAETNIIRTLVEPAGDSHGGHGGHGQKMADVPGSFGAGPPWTDGLVRFCFHADVPSRIKTLVQNAMLELEKAIPCIRFKQIQIHRTSSTNCDVYPSVIITSFDNRGCASSHLGWYSATTQQWVNLKARKPGQGHCEVLGIAIHELGHLLGMAHEQARPDAAKYVTIHWDNINPNYTRQFKVNDKADNERPYDLLSVMHYGSEAFSINDKDTITPKSSGCWHYTSDASLCERIKDNMGQRNGITQLDADQLGDLYKSQNKLCRSSLAQSNPASDGLPLQRWVPRMPLSYNTMGVAYAYPFPCKAASQTRVWTSAGGGALLWRHGNLAFYQGDDKGETIWSHVVWQSGTCADCGGGFEPRSNPGAHLCFHSNGNLVIYSQTRRLLWATGTYPGRRAPWGAWRMAIFDHHWAMMSPRIKPREGVQKEVLPYSMVRYPSEAPSSIEILPWLVGWFGCLTDVTWETLGGAQLRFHDGELVFYPGDGHGNKDDPIWRSGTKHIGKELCFAEDGNLLINWPQIGFGVPGPLTAPVADHQREPHLLWFLMALQEVLLSQTRFANFLLLFAAGSGIHVASKYRETITQHLNVTRGAASFDSAERAEWLVQLIHNLKRLPPNFWYSSAATGLLSLQIAQRLGVWCLQKTARSRIGNYILKIVFIAVFLATFRSELLAEAQVKWLRDRTQSLMASNRSQDSLQDRARAATGAAFRSV